MKLVFYVFGLFLGIILALHLSMNGKVGAAIDVTRAVST